ncbi:MAG: DUF92 domain-containing protein [Thermoplasmata archaeon]|nr:DUF92 domain-containing protein [Thermoplasmata archaeon]
MVLPLELAVVGALATGFLALAAVVSGALTRSAGLVAAAFGLVIVILGGFPYLALLVLFVVASVLATRYGFEEKQRRHVQEGTAGERGVSNVVAHIVLPTALVVGFASVSGSGSLSPVLPLLYTAALAFGAADTFASEFGVLSGKAWGILSFKPVTPGTNGGVSVLGTLWAFTGAATTSIVGWLLFYGFGSPVLDAGFAVAAALVAGFLACQVDSLLGALLENRGLLTKGSTNFLAMLSSIAIAFLLFRTLGGLV